MTNLERAAERIYSRLEHGADAAVHVLGIVFAVAATGWLLWNVSGVATVAAVSVRVTPEIVQKSPNPSFSPGASVAGAGAGAGDGGGGGGTGFAS